MNYKKGIVLGVAAYTITASAGAVAQLAQGEKDTIFIGPIKVQEAVSDAAKKAGRGGELAQISQALRSQLVTEINQTRVFQIVERERKEDIELEQAFAEVAVDINDKNRAQTLKMAGAKYAFLPQIDGFEDRRSTTRYEAIGRSSMSRSVWISATVSIVDTTTGALLPESPSVKVKSGSSAEYVRQGASLGGDELISSLTKELAEKLARESVTLMRPAKVLSTAPQILINRGTEAGFEIGTQVEFYATEDIKDEDTGEVFKNEALVGSGVIKRSDPKQSFAEVKGENLGIAKGCVVKIVKPAAPAKGVAVARKQPEAAVSAGSSDKPIQFN
jgi:curli biogenesis system outer membrane secretion channel CsgG